VSRHDKGPKGPATTPEAPAPAVESAPVETTTEAKDEPVKADPLEAFQDALHNALAEQAERVQALLAEQAEAFEQKLAGLRARLHERLDDLAQQINGLGHALNSMERDRQEAPSSDMASEVANLSAAVNGIVLALDREDLLTPTASPEQLEAAFAKGCRLKVLCDYASPGINVKAGRVLESQSSNARAIIDGVRSGRLRVSILREG
jgi:ElaB/YqjD/DUF883 family membrane-anchored ribosome-binding protein